ncbi:hypothetical protein B1A85_15100 [Chroococcidiopsis sp. TS-821]|nr:hypothetical protein B1A85_15100 [Chroococcidiopsis sp. TS-821]
MAAVVVVITREIESLVQSRDANILHQLPYFPDSRLIEIKAFLGSFFPTTAFRVNIPIATALAMINPIHLNWLTNFCYCTS